MITFMQFDWSKRTVSELWVLEKQVSCSLRPPSSLVILLYSLKEKILLLNCKSYLERKVPITLLLTLAISSWNIFV